MEIIENIKLKLFLSSFVKKLFDFYNSFSILKDYSYTPLGNNWYSVVYINSKNQETKDLIYISPDTNFNDVRYYVKDNSFIIY